MVKAHCSNFRMSTAIFSGIQIISDFYGKLYVFTVNDINI